MVETNFLGSKPFNVIMIGIVLFYYVEIKQKVLLFCQRNFISITFIITASFYKLLSHTAVTLVDRSDEGLTLATSAFIKLFTVSTQLIILNYLGNLIASRRYSQARLAFSCKQCRS